MIAGLPVGAWILLAASVWIGLAIELAFWWSQRSGPRRDPPPPGSPEP